MHLDTLYNEVVKTLSETLRIDATKIQPNSRLVEDLDITSLDIYTIAIEIEEKYGKDLFEDRISGLNTVSDLVAYVQVRMQKAGITI